MESLIRRTKHIFLSPHLDDAVFSCGGLIAKASSLGCPTEIITFYTKRENFEILPPRQQKIVPKFAVYEQRKKEDYDALSFLGATPIWADYTERFIRRPWLKSVLHAFRTPLEASLGGFANVFSIKKYLNQLCEEWPEAYVYAPFGIGNHYDHVELFLASIMAAVEKRALDRFVFYEDVYSLGTRMRKSHFAAKRMCWRWRHAPATRSIKWFLRSNLIALNARGRTAVEYLPAHCASLTWSVKTESIAGFEEKKLEAVSMYKSQTEALGGMRMISRIIRCFHLFWGNAEPYWFAHLDQSADRNESNGPGN